MPKNKLPSSIQTEATKSRNVRARNPYAQHPLMQKGGLHQKSKSALTLKIIYCLKNSI